MSQKTTTEAVAFYQSFGLHPVPVPAGEKGPRVIGWETIDFDVSDFGDGDNIGVRLGPDFVDVDLDCPEAVACAGALLPETGSIFGHAPSKPASHYVYSASGLDYKKFEDVDGSTLVEQRTANGRQTIFPNSLHGASGEPITFMHGFPVAAPARIDPEGLGISVRDVAICALFSRHYPKKGSRRDVVLHMSGFLASLGLPAARVEAVIRQAALFAHDEEVNARIRIARESVETFIAGGKTTGGPSLEAALGADRVARIRSWFPDEGASYDVRLKKAIEQERIKREARRAVDHEEVPPAVIPKAQSLAVRLKAPRPAQQWRIEGLMQKHHRSLIAAQAKTGKTTTVVNVVKALTDGELQQADLLGRRDHRVKLFGSFPVEPVQRVVVLDFEMADDDPGQLDDWYRGANLAHPERVQIVPLRGRASAFNILDAPGRQKWADVIRGADVVVWDCLSTVCMALNVDENKDGQKLLIAFDELLKLAGVTEAIVVQHMGHNNERARGASGILAWPDVLWTIVRDDDGESRFFKAEGRGVHVAESGLTFDPDTSQLKLIGGSRKDAKPWNTLRAIGDVLKDDTTKNQSEIIAALTGKVSRDAVVAGLQHGIGVKALGTEPGPKNATVYRVLDVSRLTREGGDVPF